MPGRLRWYGCICFADKSPLLHSILLLPLLPLLILLHALMMARIYNDETYSTTTINTIRKATRKRPGSVITAFHVSSKDVKCQNAKSPQVIQKWPKKLFVPAQDGRMLVYLSLSAGRNIGHFFRHRSRNFGA